jgi:hypothetical protein
LARFGHDNDVARDESDRERREPFRHIHNAQAIIHAACESCRAPSDVCACLSGRDRVSTSANRNGFVCLDRIDGNDTTVDQWNEGVDRLGFVVG